MTHLRTHESHIGMSKRSKQKNGPFQQQQDGVSSLQRWICCCISIPPNRGLFISIYRAGKQSAGRTLYILTQRDLMQTCSTSPHSPNGIKIYFRIETGRCWWDPLIPLGCREYSETSACDALIWQAKLLQAA